MGEVEGCPVVDAPDPWGPVEPIPPPELVSGSRTRPVEDTPPARQGEAEGLETLFTDLGNARRIVKKAKGNVRWSAALPGSGDLGGYVAWNGKKWRPDSDGIAHRVAKNMTRDLFDEANEKHGDARGKWMKWAFTSQGAGAIASAMRLARTEPEMKVNIEDFDSDQMAYRVTYRLDAQPWWVAALTPYKGSNTQSPVVTLATRS